RNIEYICICARSRRAIFRSRLSFHFLFPPCRKERKRGLVRKSCRLRQSVARWSRLRRIPRLPRVSQTRFEALGRPWRAQRGIAQATGRPVRRPGLGNRARRKNLGLEVPRCTRESFSEKTSRSCSDCQPPGRKPASPIPSESQKAHQG